jgi:hypothetical protein
MPHIYLYRDSVDFRKSYRGLGAIVEQELEQAITDREHVIEDHKHIIKEQQKPLKLDGRETTLGSPEALRGLQLEATLSRRFL